MAKNGILYGTAISAAAGIGTYLILNGIWGPGQAARRVGGFVRPDVEEKLPLAKDLPTIADEVGNYDIDGVSYDTEGVVVSSDKNVLPQIETFS